MGYRRERERRRDRHTGRRDGGVGEKGREGETYRQTGWGIGEKGERIERNFFRAQRSSRGINLVCMMRVLAP